MCEVFFIRSTLFFSCINYHEFVITLLSFDDHDVVEFSMTTLYFFFDSRPRYEFMICAAFRRFNIAITFLNKLRV